MTTPSERFTQARQHIPGGVNSPVRAFNGVGGDPVFIDHAAGATSMIRTESATLTMWAPGGR